MCASHVLEDVSQENTIFQVRYFWSFENTCVLQCIKVVQTSGSH